LQCLAIWVYAKSQKGGVSEPTKALGKIGSAYCGNVLCSADVGNGKILISTSSGYQVGLGDDTQGLDNPADA
jgi:hypothetical protein